MEATVVTIRSCPRDGSYLTIGVWHSHSSGCLCLFLGVVDCNQLCSFLNSSYLVVLVPRLVDT